MSRGGKGRNYPQDIHKIKFAKFFVCDIFIKPLAGVSEAGEKGLTSCQAFFYNFEAGYLAPLPLIQKSSNRNVWAFLFLGMKSFAEITIPISSNFLVMFAKSYFMTERRRCTEFDILPGIVDRYQVTRN